MILRIVTPTAIVVDEHDVSALRAEDDSGGFGVLERHADLFTVLSISILQWQNRAGDRHFCALRRGLLTVRGGCDVMVATREAVLSDDSEALENVVLARFRETAERERSARVESAAMQMAAVKRMIRHLRPEIAAGVGGP
jgi:F-type H+-transporting ATPase subunit epsilon